MKRIFDILASTLGLIILSPLFLLVAVLIKIKMPGPVFYQAERIGKGGRPFSMWKFRSMRVGADRMGPKITVKNDERITPFGQWLRKYKIDEFPQLINVMMGEMSLVGPRPEDPAYASRYNTRQRGLLFVRPGITSPASLRYYYEEHVLEPSDLDAAYVSEILPKKLQIELDYIQNRTLWSDIGVILRTIFAVLRLGPKQGNLSPTPDQCE